MYFSGVYDDNKFNNINETYIEMRRGWRGHTGQRWLTSTVKVWRANNLVFCSGYNAPTLFRNLYKRYLMCKDLSTHVAHYSSRSTHYNFKTT